MPDEDDAGIMAYALTQLRNDDLFGKLTSEQQAWLVTLVEASMRLMADVDGRNYPHHGSAAMIAQLHKADLLSDEALGLACVFTAAMERWERDHAGA